MFPAASSANSPDIKLPLKFLVTGVIAFFLLNFLFFWAIPAFGTGNFRGPVMWTVAHLTLLGWGTMIAMGAMYQLVTVAFQVPLYSEKLGTIQYYIYTIGVLGLLWGFFSFNPFILNLFGFLAFLGALLFIYNIFKTIGKMSKQTYISAFVLSSVSYLFLTVLLGLILALNLKWSFLGSLYNRLFPIHILLGLIGWFTLLIIGFSFKMVPMFTLSHGFSEKWPRWILTLFHGGIISTSISLILEEKFFIVIGLILIAAAFFFFAVHVKGIISKKMKKKLDIGIETSLKAIVIGLILFILFPVSLIWYGENKLILTLIYLFIYGWISLSILGYLYKIIPFLWWTAKYSTEIGKSNVPQLKDLISESLGKKIFLLVIIGTIGFSISILTGYSSILYLMQSITMVGVILYTYSVLNVFRK